MLKVSFNLYFIYDKLYVLFYYKGWLVVEIMRSGTKWPVPARSPGPDSPAGYRLVPMEGMGLHVEKGDDDDPAKGLAVDDGWKRCFVIAKANNKYAPPIIF